jgi:hypothetical protein
MAPKVKPHARRAVVKRRPAVRRPAADIAGTTAVAAAQAAATAAAVADVVAGAVVATATASETDFEAQEVEAAAATRRRTRRRVRTPGGDYEFYSPTPRLHVMTPTGKTITVVLEASSTFADVKAQIQNKEGVHPDNQQLFFDGKLFTDRTPVWSYGLEWDDTIVLRIIDELVLLCIYYETGNADFAGHRSCVISCRGSDLIGTVKAKIEYETGIRVLQQSLVFNECKLQNGNTVDYYSLGDGCRVRITDHDMNFA